MDRKKELREQYKQMKPAMGIFIVRCKLNNKCFLKTTQDLRGVMNGTIARLQGGRHPNRELLKEWIELGEDNFEMEILQTLEYDKDETKTDYSAELEVMQMLWEEKLAGQNKVLYKQRL